MSGPSAIYLTRDDMRRKPANLPTGQVRSHIVVTRTGTRISLRWLRPQGHGGSSPPFRTKKTIVRTGHIGNSSFLRARRCA